MTEKRFTLGKVACYRTCLIKDKGVKLGNSKICDLLNELSDENEQLKQDKKRLIGFLHRYKGVDVEDVDEEVLSKEYLDEWGELYYSER